MHAKSTCYVCLYQSSTVPQSSTLRRFNCNVNPLVFPHRRRHAAHQSVSWLKTQMIVTTPEKWDVITRKGGDVAVASLVEAADH